MASIKNYRKYAKYDGCIALPPVLGLEVTTLNLQIKPSDNLFAVTKQTLFDRKWNQYNSITVQGA
jgi:hypothetical protein